MIRKVYHYYKNRPKIEFKNGFYQRKDKGIIAYSKHRNTLMGTFTKIFVNRIYDFETDNAIPFIIDGGANIGLGVLYWKMVYPKAQITAFEPSKEVIKMLHHNLSANHIGDVDVKEMALSGDNGTMSFTTNEALSGSLMTQKKLENNYNVQTARLSDYITREVELLKLDIEGAELDVLKEIQSKLHLIKRLFVEFHSFIDEPLVLSELLSILEKTGFRYHIDAEYKLDSPFNGFKESLGQDLQLNIWAKKD